MPVIGCWEKVVLSNKNAFLDVFFRLLVDY
jgi:hypothetical protein